MPGLPFIEGYKAVLRRIYVVHDSAATSGPGFAKLEKALSTATGYSADIVPLEIPAANPGKDLIRAREQIRMTRPAICRRSLVGVGTSACTALALSLMASVDEVFAFDPSPEAMSGPLMDLRLASKGAIDPQTLRHVFSHFNTQSKRTMLASLSQWANCVVAGPELIMSEMSPPFADLLADLPGTRRVRLPKGSFSLVMSQAA
jgi:hypothetical protein